MESLKNIENFKKCLRANYDKMKIKAEKYIQKENINVEERTELLDYFIDSVTSDISLDAFFNKFIKKYEDYESFKEAIECKIENDFNLLQFILESDEEEISTIDLKSDEECEVFMKELDEMMDV